MDFALRFESKINISLSIELFSKIIEEEYVRDEKFIDEFIPFPLSILLIYGTTSHAQLDSVLLIVSPFPVKSN